MGIAVGVQGNALGDFDTRLHQRCDLARVIGHQSNRRYLQVPAHRGQHAVVPHIGAKAQLFIGLDSVSTLVLQLVGLDLVEKAYATTLLAQVEKGSATFCRDGLESCLQLVTAITTHAEQGIAGKAFRMHTGEDRLTIANIAHGEYHVLLVGSRVLKTVHPEIAPQGGET